MVGGSFGQVQNPDSVPQITVHRARNRVPADSGVEITFTPGFSPRGSSMQIEVNFETWKECFSDLPDPRVEGRTLHLQPALQVIESYRILVR